MVPNVFATRDQVCGRHFLHVPGLGRGGGDDDFAMIQVHTRASLVAQTVKHLPAVQETLVQSLGWEDPLEKEMATHSSILAWRIP